MSVHGRFEIFVPKDDTEIWGITSILQKIYIKQLDNKYLL
jgi:hypothetical protein